MLKKLFVGVIAAGALSVPLAGVAWADQPADPGAGNNGVPDRATAVVESQLSDNGVPQATIDAFIAAAQSGKSGNVAPGTAFSTGAKVPGMNTPDGYGAALNDYYRTHSDPVFDPGFVRVIPGQVTRTLTNHCAQHPTGTNCTPPSP